MRGMTVRVVALSLVSGAAFACLFPTDRSGEVTVQMDPLPALFLKDTVQLSGRVVDENGADVPNAEIQFASQDSSVVLVTSDGRLLAVGVGNTNVTATAISFDGSQPAVLPVVVHGLLEVDSIRPKAVRFGDTVAIYGVGLEPDSLFSVTLGGAELPIFQFTPQDPDAPDRFGTLTLWAKPPADRFSTVSVLGFRGGVVHPDTVLVFQFDVFEPNDTVPADLGDLPLGYANPGLAFEQIRRDVVVAADWYTFTNTTAQDRTIIVGGEDVGAEIFQVFLTNGLSWDGVAFDYTLRAGSWTIGPELYICDGLTMTRFGAPFQPSQLPFPISVLALGDLPAGTYHILAPFVAAPKPNAYGLLIANGYLSFRARDVAEENDYCDVAKPLATGTSAAQLSIDNPQDVDWFEFSVPAGGQTVAFSAVSPDTLVDIDLYIIRDFRPLSLTVVDLSVDFGTPETLSAFLPQGSYFLLVVDFAGIPGIYTLSATFTAPPAGVAPVRAAPSPAQVELRRLKEQLVRERRDARLRRFLPRATRR